MQQILILRIASLVFYLLALIVLVLEWYYKVETSRYLPYVNEHYEWFPLAIAAVAFICERTANKELKAMEEAENPDKSKKTKKTTKTTKKKATGSKSKTVKKTTKTKKTSKS